jgi:tetratricopeptide (TPR) repeat protein
MRPVILGTLVACLAVAMAPWLSGGQEPVAMLLSGGALMLAALLAWRQPEVRVLKWGPLAVSFGLLVGFALLSLLWSANRYSSALWVVQWVMAGLAFKLAYTVAGEVRGPEWVIRAYLGSAVVFCVVGVVMFLTSDYDRLTGTFYWANPAAAYLIPAIVLGIDRVRRAAGRRVWWWVGAVVVFLGSFLLTDSRGGTLVLALVLGVYLLLASTNKRFWINFVFSMVLGFGLSLGLSWMSTFTGQHHAKVVPGSRFAEAASGESKSTSDRLYYLGSALDMWLAHPWGGTGAGTYRDVHPQYQKRVISASSNAHNFYVQTLAELGLVGILALVAVVLWLLAGGLRGLVAEPEMVPVAIGALGLVLHFGLDIDASYPALLLLAAALIGLVYRQASQGRGKASWRWPAVAVVLMAPLISLYQSNVWAERGRAQQTDGDYATAADDFGAAHSGWVYNPDFVNAEGIDLLTLAYGNAAGAKADAQLALERARQAQREDRYDAQHHQLEGRALSAQGDLKGAAAAFREALRLDPYNHPDYALDLARVQQQTGDVDGAVRTAQAMLAQYPQEVVDNRSNDATVKPALADLEALVGNVYLKQGRLREAGEAATRALKLDPDSLRGRALRHQVELH